MHRWGQPMEERDFSHDDQECRKCFPWLSATLWHLHFLHCVNYVQLWVPYQNWASSTQSPPQGKQAFSKRACSTIRPDNKWGMQKQRQREMTHLWGISYEYRKAHGSQEDPVTALLWHSSSCQRISDQCGSNSLDGHTAFRVEVPLSFASETPLQIQMSLCIVKSLSRFLYLLSSNLSLLWFIYFWCFTQKWLLPWDKAALSLLTASTWGKPALPKGRPEPREPILCADTEWTFFSSPAQVTN